MTLGFTGDDARRKVAVLLTLCFALFMAMLDNTVVNVALPTLTRELDAGVSQLQWIVDGYALAFASLLLTGGTLGDAYGRKRIFMSGLAIFTVASFASGLSQTSGQLIAFRVLQGVGAALLMPGTLSILTVTFGPEERAKAIGIWAGVSGLALALGPTLGGWMVERFGWESVFFLNVPIGIVGFVIAFRVISESRSDRARTLDIPGLVLGTTGLFGLTYGLIEVNRHGWTDPLILTALLGGTLLLVALLFWEHHSDTAMLPLSFFRLPAFSAGNWVAFSISFGMFGIFFFVSLYMQLIRGESPLEAGVRFLPLTGMIVLVAPLAGRIAQRYGSRLPMTFGLTLAGTGLLLFSRVGATTPYALMVPTFVMMGVGIASTMGPMTAAVMNAVGPQRAGLGSAMTNTSREVGGVFGIALLGTLLTTRLSADLGPALARIGLTPEQAKTIGVAASHGQLDSRTLEGLTPDQVAAVQHAFSTAFLSGFRIALIVAAGVLLVAAVIANRFIPSGAPVRDTAEARGETPEPIGA